MRSELFISYARENENSALKLKSDLENIGFSVWIDVEKSYGKKDWPLYVARGLREVDTIIALVSRDFVHNGRYAKYEINEALRIIEKKHAGGQIIRGQLDDSDPTQPQLKKIAPIMLYPDWHIGVMRMAEIIKLNKGEIDKDSPPLSQEYDTEEPPGNVNIISMLKRTMENIDYYAKRRDIKLILKNHKDSMFSLSDGYDQALSLSFMNIFHNAIKYTFKVAKSIYSTVVINPFRKKGCVQIEIENVGLPIEDFEVRRIFQKGYRGSQAAMFDKSGLGIGLFNTKQIVEKHSGKIAIGSMPLKRNIGKSDEFTPWLTKVIIELPVI
ncbi:MAG: TIR domain-containing protein [Bacteroidales bacterium]|nr:TIR domain-containing protein [Candidatus Latescibacterota bacterium]